MGVDSRYADRALIEEGVRLANIPALLMVLVQITGDLTWLEAPYTPTLGRGLSDHDTGGLPVDVQAEIREHASEAILKWRHGDVSVAIPAPPPDLVVKMMSVCMGQEVPPEYGPMLALELQTTSTTQMIGHGPNQHPAPDWPPPGSCGDWPYVLIVGAGLSGIAAGIALKKRGIRFQIVEKAGNVGGVWLQNHYPGCGVDTPSHYYSFSFAPYDWTHYFASRDQLCDYVEDIRSSYNLTNDIRLRTEVTHASYDPEWQKWTVRLRTPTGSEEVLYPDILISAVGAFARLKKPEIAGLGNFQGTQYHTAQWPTPAPDLSGKRVAVIGNGASAMQCVTALAETVSRLTVFQRSPQWIAPHEQHGKAIPDPVRFLIREVPLYRAWYRLRLNWIFTDKIHAGLQKDPSWPHPQRAVNALNDGYRRVFTRYVESELGEGNPLIDAVLPDYPPFGKRILLDHGWFKTLMRENVRLVTDPISQVSERGVVLASGEVVEVDVMVLATGFEVARFISTMDIEGLSGRNLREAWDDDDARAYLGCAIRGFPNFFCIYGPNTQNAGGSIIFMVENQINYIVKIVEQMIEQHLGSVEVRQDVFEQYNQEVDDAHEQMIWTHPGFTTYYRNRLGRVVVVNPFRMVDSWELYQGSSISMFEALPRSKGG